MLDLTRASKNYLVNSCVSRCLVIWKEGWESEVKYSTPIPTLAFTKFPTPDSDSGLYKFSTPTPWDKGTEIWLLKSMDIEVHSKKSVSTAACQEHQVPCPWVMKRDGRQNKEIDTRIGKTNVVIARATKFRGYMVGVLDLKALVFPYAFEESVDCHLLSSFCDDSNLHISLFKYVLSTMGGNKESISKFLIGNRFHVKLRIRSPYSKRIESFSTHRGKYILGGSFSLLLSVAWWLATDNFTFVAATVEWTWSNVESSVTRKKGRQFDSLFKWLRVMQHCRCNISFEIP